MSMGRQGLRQAECTGEMMPILYFNPFCNTGQLAKVMGNREMAKKKKKYGLKADQGFE